MIKYDLIYASGLSGGLSLASLVEVLRVVNWPSVLMLIANILVSLYTWQKAELAERRRRDAEKARSRERPEASPWPPRSEP